MKVVFLDVDGVLNSEKYMRLRFNENGNERLDYPYSEFDPDAVNRFNTIVEKTGTEIVVSSTWRLGRSFEDLQILFKRVGIRGNIIGVTPALHDRGKYGETVRGDEIKQWLEEAKEFFSEKEISYVIVDDDNDMLKEQQNNFIKTSWMSGLEDHHVEEAIKILNKS